METEARHGRGAPRAPVPSPSTERGSRCPYNGDLSRMAPVSLHPRSQRVVTGRSTETGPSRRDPGARGGHFRRFVALTGPPPRCAAYPRSQSPRTWRRAQRPKRGWPRERPRPAWGRPRRRCSRERGWPCSPPDIFHERLARGGGRPPKGPGGRQRLRCTFARNPDVGAWGATSPPRPRPLGPARAIPRAQNPPVPHFPRPNHHRPHKGSVRRLSPRENHTELTWLSAPSRPASRRRAAGMVRKRGLNALIGPRIGAPVVPGGLVHVHALGRYFARVDVSFAVPGRVATPIDLFRSTPRGAIPRFGSTTALGRPVLTIPHRGPFSPDSTPMPPPSRVVQTVSLHSRWSGPRWSATVPVASSR